MPLQLLHIWGIFPDTLGLFAIRSCHLPRAAPDPGNPTGPIPCRLLPTVRAPADQSCWTGQGGLTPPLAKPAKLIKQPVSSYSPRRIAQVVSTSWTTLILDRVVPFAKAKGPISARQRYRPIRRGEKAGLTPGLHLAKWCCRCFRPSALTEGGVLCHELPSIRSCAFAISPRQNVRRAFTCESWVASGSRRGA